MIILNLFVLINVIYLIDFDDEIEDEVCLHGDALVSNEDLEKLSKDQLLENYYNLKTQHETSVKVVNELREFIKKNIIDDIDDISAINQKSKVSTLNDQTDSGYISSYSHFSIHHSMLSDKPRTLAYKNAILQNESFFKGKSVLDIGCGTGILSLFAAKAGAEIVVAIDHSDIIYQAMDIVFKNGYQNVIKTVKGKLEQIDFKKLELPTKYDIILSEWMGYFLLFEGMVDTVIHARDNLMATNGILLPNRCELFLAAFSDKNFYTNNISFWNDVYGFDMSSIIKDVTKEATIDVASNQSICSSIEKIYEMNVTNCSLENVQTVVSAFDFRFEKETEVHGIVGWFDCHFDSMNKPFTLSTSPTSESTHWKQTIFPFDQAISVKSNENLKGEIQISRDPSDVRALKIEIKLKDSKFVYNLC